MVHRVIQTIKLACFSEPHHIYTKIFLGGYTVPPIISEQGGIVIQ